MLSKYGIYGVIRIFLSVIYTRIFLKPARLIRLPVDIRNKKYIEIGKSFTAGIGCRIEAYPVNNTTVIHMGENIQMNDYVHITAVEGVSIGNNVLIASKVYISDCSHGKYADGVFSDPETAPADRPLYSKKVVIEDNVWIGEFVSVLPGVTIGRGCIIGTMSVVNKSIPPFCIAVGAPAKVVKKYNFATREWESVKE